MKKENQISDSIFKKRLKRFKSIKRGYYSLIILISLYVMSLLAPLIINKDALLVCYANRQYDSGEKYEDNNYNNIWDNGEEFIDEYNYYFPVFNNLFGKKYFEAKNFGQKTVLGKKRFGAPHYRFLKNQFEKENKGNYVIMPLYPYGPYEDVITERDEPFTDINNNGKWDNNEPFEDNNNNNKRDNYGPAEKPNLINILGTDNQGRDVFARLVYGLKVSLSFGLIVTVFAYTIGIIVGGTIGYFGGKVDLFGLRFIEIFSAMPFLFLMMIFSQIMKPGIILLALMYMLITGWIGISWYVRGEFYREKSKDYVSAAVSMGQSTWKVIIKHILPNALTPIITFAPFAVISYITALVSLDFLGFGLQPPTPSWGELLLQGKTNLQYRHLIIVPLSAIGTTLFLITFIGEAVREAFDPKVFSRLR
tara:strand:- start:1490 stop:2752 length:1263 start_codon:yes stop_codon:yes gene_type:complete